MNKNSAYNMTHWVYKSLYRIWLPSPKASFSGLIYFQVTILKAMDQETIINVKESKK